MKAVMYDLKIWKGVLKTIGLAGKFSMVKYRADWPKPEILHPNQVIVKTQLGGICGSDIHQLQVKGSYFTSILASKTTPFPIGHETVGIIEEIGSNIQNLKIGDTVVFDPTATCEAYGFELCSSCQVGRYASCLCLTGTGDGSKLEEKYGGKNNWGGYGGGGFSEYVLGFEKQFYIVPENVPIEVAVLAEPFAVSIHAVANNLPKDSDTVIVIGAGIIGLLVIAALRAYGSKCQIITLARYPLQADWAKKLGSNEVIIERKTDLLYEKIAELTNGKLYKPMFSKKVLFGNIGPDIIFDCVSNNHTLDDSLRLVRSNGRIVILGLDFGVTKKVDWSIAAYKEIEVIGSMIYGLDDFQGRRKHSFEIALEILGKNPILYQNLVTHKFPIDEYKSAYNVAMHKGKHQAIKVAFEFPK